MMIGLEVAPVAPKARLAVDLVGIDRIEPQFRAAGDQRLQRGQFRHKSLLPNKEVAEGHSCVL